MAAYFTQLRQLFSATESLIYYPQKHNLLSITPKSQIKYNSTNTKKNHSAALIWFLFGIFPTFRNKKSWVHYCIVVFILTNQTERTNPTIKTTSTNIILLLEMRSLSNSYRLIRRKKNLSRLFWFFILPKTYFRVDLRWIFGILLSLRIYDKVADMRLRIWVILLPSLNHFILIFRLFLHLRIEHIYFKVFRFRR